jgi:O-antigen ligase
VLPVDPVLVAFWLACQIDLPPERLLVLHRTALSACVFVCLSCVATYYGLVSTSDLSGHLASSIKFSGPWGPYIRGVREGIGTTNYNHCFTGVQILMLTALSVHTKRPSTLSPWLAALSVGAVFLSEHRTGLVLMSVFAVITFRPKTPHLVAALLALCIAGSATMFMWGDMYDSVSGTVERHSTIPDSYAVDGFALRDQIWASRLAFLNENKIRWIAGTGFGSAPETGPNAHMLYLHIVIECGLIGLSLFLAFVWRVLRVLWSTEGPPRALFWATICLLITSITEETFYPVAAFGHFIGLFLASIAIAIRQVDY